MHLMHCTYGSFEDIFLHLIKRKEYLEVSIQRSLVAAFITPDEDTSTKGQNMGSCSLTLSVICTINYTNHV